MDQQTRKEQKKQPSSSPDESQRLVTPTPLRTPDVIDDGTSSSKKSPLKRLRDLSKRVLFSNKQQHSQSNDIVEIKDDDDETEVLSVNNDVSDEEDVKKKKKNDSSRNVANDDDDDKSTPPRKKQRTQQESLSSNNDKVRGNYAKEIASSTSKAVPVTPDRPAGKKRRKIVTSDNSSINGDDNKINGSASITKLSKKNNGKANKKMPEKSSEIVTLDADLVDDSTTENTLSQPPPAETVKSVSAGLSKYKWKGLVAFVAFDAILMSKLYMDSRVAFHSQQHPVVISDNNSTARFIKRFRPLKPRMGRNNTTKTTSSTKNVPTISTTTKRAAVTDLTTTTTSATNTQTDGVVKKVFQYEDALFSSSDFVSIVNRGDKQKNKGNTISPQERASNFLRSVKSNAKKILPKKRGGDKNNNSDNNKSTSKAVVSVRSHKKKTTRVGNFLRNVRSNASKILSGDASVKRD